MFENSMTKESFGNVYFKEPGLETYKIYVGNLAPQTSDQDLRNKFEKYGPVIEASALPGKGFGFVHMANEDVGAKAMKSLYKTFLHGKEMVIQPAVNPKRAQQYNSSRRSFFGRSSSNLDSFDDKDRQYDQCQYIDREIANVISADTPPPRSPTQEYQNFSNKMGSSMNSLNSYDSRNNNFTSSNGLGHFNGTSPTNMLGVNNGNPSNSLMYAGSNVNNSISRASAWQMGSSAAPTNSILGSKDGFSMDPFLKSSDQNLNLKFGTQEIDQKILVLDGKLKQLQGMLGANPGNPNILDSINNVTKELKYCQQEKSLAEQLAKEQAYRLMLEEEKRKAKEFPWSSSIGQPTQGINSLGMNSLHNSTFLPPTISMSSKSNFVDDSVSGLLTNLSTTGASMSSLNSFNTSNQLGMFSGKDNILSSTILGSSFNGGGNDTPTYSCGICNCAYDNDDHLPKILGCTHTYCLHCLQVAANLGKAEGNVIRCPGNCGLTTELTVAGVAGLTTNQGILTTITTMPSVDMPILQQSLSNLNMDEEVCASCTTAENKSAPASACRDAGHTMVRAQDAISLIVTKLRPIIEDSILALKDAITIRKDIKRRVDVTIASLDKFLGELRQKSTQEAANDRALSMTLNELNSVKGNLENQSYPELVRTYHMVDKFAKDVKTQYSQVVRVGILNRAVKSLSLESHEMALSKLGKLGLSRIEEFELDKNLVTHAENGNYANVLLHYITSDLLSSRASQANAFSYDDREGRDYAMASVSPTMDGTIGVDTSIFSHLNDSTTVTPDITNAMDGAATHASDFDDIENLLKTTERIEAETANEKKKLSEFTNDSTALVSNISQLVKNNPVDNVQVDVEDQFLDGSVNLSSVHDPYQISENGVKNSGMCAPESNDAQSNPDSSSGSDSGIAANGNSKVFSYLDAAKKPAKPQPDVPKNEVAKMAPYLKPAKSPHCWMKIAVDGKTIGRIVFQLRPDKAPRMCENFMGLCNGTESGLGYKNTHFFKNGDGFLAGGDVEYDDGSGGYSIFNDGNFEADLCPLKDEVGMIRFKGNGTSDAGRGMVGSQFMIWYAEREFKKFAFSLVFGRVVDGMDVVKKAANVNLTKSDVCIEDCGATM